MNKHIPFEKLSKRQQRELNALRRTTWGELNPVTRKPENSKAYNRAKAQSWKKSTAEPFILNYCFDAYSPHLQKTGAKRPCLDFYS